MKTYSKDQLQEMAKPHFERLGVKKLFATSDGQFFLLENRALLHAAGRNVYPLDSDSAVSSPKPLSIETLSAWVNQCTDIEALRGAMLKEVGNANRSEAIEVIDLRIRELINDPKDPSFRGDADDEIKKTITQEDLALNPELSEQGVKVGDEVTFSGKLTEEEEAEAMRQLEAVPVKKATKKATEKKEPASKKSAAKKK